VPSFLLRRWAECSNGLQTIESFKRRKISLWLLDLGNDCGGNGISELIVTVLAATARFERLLISERVKDTKRYLRRAGKHRAGNRPFGRRLGEAIGTGRARELVLDPAEQKAIATMRKMRVRAASLMAMRDAVRAKGFAISHETARGILAPPEGEAA